MSKKNPTITVYPVSWNGAGEQLKCQAVAELNGVRIFSDPKSDMDEAVTSLYAKCVDYCKLVTALSEYGSAPFGPTLFSNTRTTMIRSEPRLTRRGNRLLLIKQYNHEQQNYSTYPH